eukprot:365450-Chlamydomonas_euryale.AAC.2
MNTCVSRTAGDAAPMPASRSNTADLLRDEVVPVFNEVPKVRGLVHGVRVHERHGGGRWQQQQLAQQAFERTAFCGVEALAFDALDSVDGVLDHDPVGVGRVDVLAARH